MMKMPKCLEPNNSVLMQNEKKAVNSLKSVTEQGRGKLNDDKYGGTRRPTVSRVR